MPLPSRDSGAWPTYIFICSVPCPFLFLCHFICSLACSIKPLTYAAVACCQRHSPFLPSLFRKPISIRYCCYIAVISALQPISPLQSVERLQMPNNALPCSVNWFQGCMPFSVCMCCTRCAEHIHTKVLQRFWQYHTTCSLLNKCLFVLISLSCIFSSASEGDEELSLSLWSIGKLLYLQHLSLTPQNCNIAIPEAVCSIDIILEFGAD